MGTQYRSAIFWYGSAQQTAALASRDAYNAVLEKAGMGRITTEIRETPEFFYAEAYHQQYLAKNPGGDCGIGGTGISCPVGSVQKVYPAGHAPPVATGRLPDPANPEGQGRDASASRRTDS